MRGPTPSFASALQQFNIFVKKQSGDVYLPDSNLHPAWSLYRCCRHSRTLDESAHICQYVNTWELIKRLLFVGAGLLLLMLGEDCIEGDLQVRYVFTSMAVFPWCKEVRNLSRITANRLDCLPLVTVRTESRERTCQNLAEILWGIRH